MGLNDFPCEVGKWLADCVNAMSYGSLMYYLCGIWLSSTVVSLVLENINIF